MGDVAAKCQVIDNNNRYKEILLDIKMEYELKQNYVNKIKEYAQGLYKQNLNLPIYMLVIGKNCNDFANDTYFEER